MAPRDPNRLSVLEIGSGAAASFASRYLLALGARVSKALIEGQPRSLPELDAGKDCHEASHQDSEALIRDLAATSDVVLWAGQPQEMTKVGPLLDELRVNYPSLITGAITPFGEGGPHSSYEGTDLIAINSGGLGYGTPPRVTDPELEHPLGIPGDVAEPLTGLVLALGVLDAVVQRDIDGRGRHVGVSAQEAVASLMFNNIATFVETGRSPGRLAADRPAARRQFLTCADGLLVMMAGRPHHREAWRRLLRGEDLQAESSFPNDQPGDDERSIDSWTITKTRREITDLAQSDHIPIEPVLEPEEVLQCQQLAARGFWEMAPDGSKLAGHPFGPISQGASPKFMPRMSQNGAAERTWRDAPQPEGPLAGVKVLDFTWVFAGPIASRILAALGATVVKIERPGDDGVDRPFLARTLQGGKLSLVQDLSQPSVRASVRELAEEADIIIENFSTGVMEKHGLGWQDLKRKNPRLIMTSISGMGRTGPYSHHVMLGQLAQGYSGLTSLIGYENGPPRGIEDGGFWSDPVTGYAAAAATLAALREREVTQVGRRIDISLTEATVATLLRPLLAAQRTSPPLRRGNYHPEMAPHDVYRCAPPEEDSWFALAVRSDEEWARIASLIGQPYVSKDPRFSTLWARQEHRRELRELVESWSRKFTPAEATAQCQSVGIAAAPCLSTRGLVLDVHLRSVAFIVEEDGNPAYVRLPWTLDPAEPRIYGRPPGRNEHAEVFSLP